jgi:hypothetical protein
MTKLELFKKIRAGGYNKTCLGVDWKIDGDMMLFEQSRC